MAPEATDVTNALVRLDRALAGAGLPELAEELEPGIPPAEIRARLRGIDMSTQTDVVNWFSYHNGGWSTSLRLELLSLDEAVATIDEEAIRAASLYDASNWLPFARDRTAANTTFIVDAASGAVLALDVIMELFELAPTLSSWLDALTRRVLGADAEVSDGRSVAPRRIAATTQPARSEPAPQPAAPRRLTAASPRYWSPRRGTIEATRMYPDGKIVVGVNGSNGSSLYLVDPLDLADKPEPFARCSVAIRNRSLRITTDGSAVLINNAWLSVDGGPLEQLPAEATWGTDATDGSLLLLKGEETQFLYDTASKATRPVDPSARLFGRYVMWVTGAGSNELHLQAVEASGNGAEETKVLSAATVGFDGFGELLHVPERAQVIVQSRYGENGIALLDLREGSLRAISTERLRPKFTTHDGDVVFATDCDYPTERALRIGTHSGATEEIGQHQPESAGMVTDAAGLRFAHHVVLESHDLGVELVDLGTGAASTVEINARAGADLGYALWLTESAVVYDEQAERGGIGVAAAPIVDGVLGESVPLGDGAPLSGWFGVVDEIVAWPVETALQWSHSSGGGALMSHPTLGRHRWHLTDAAVVIDEADRLAVIRHDEWEPTRSGGW